MPRLYTRRVPTAAITTTSRYGSTMCRKKTSGGTAGRNPTAIAMADMMGTTLAEASAATSACAGRLGTVIVKAGIPHRYP